MASSPNSPRTLRIGGTVLELDDVTVALAETHSTGWRPTGDLLAKLERETAFGMDDAAALSGKIQLIEALSFLKLFALSRGLRENAINLGASIIVAVEQLASNGSEAGAAGMQMTADILRRDGIADEAFASARSILERGA